MDVWNSCIYNIMYIMQAFICLFYFAEMYNTTEYMYVFNQIN